MFEKGKKEHQNICFAVASPQKVDFANRVQCVTLDSHWCHGDHNMVALSFQVVVCANSVLILVIQQVNSIDFSNATSHLHCVTDGESDLGAKVNRTEGIGAIK